LDNSILLPEHDMRIWLGHLLLHLVSTEQRGVYYHQCYDMCNVMSSLNIGYLVQREKKQQVIAFVADLIPLDVLLSVSDDRLRRTIKLVDPRTLLNLPYDKYHMIRAYMQDDFFIIPPSLELL
jgi:hypothetical protein